MSDHASNGIVVLAQAVRSLPGLAVSLWLGGMGCFAFLVAPAAFATLDREAAGRLVTALFPRYYLTGIVLGAVTLVGCVGRGISKGRGSDWLPLGLVVLMLACTIYAWAVVLPAAHAAREALRASGGGAAATEAVRFARLHRLSGVLNVAVMAAGIVFLVMEATRRP